MSLRGGDREREGGRPRLSLFPSSPVCLSNHEFYFGSARHLFEISNFKFILLTSGCTLEAKTTFSLSLSHLKFPLSILKAFSILVQSLSSLCLFDEDDNKIINSHLYQTLAFLSKHCFLSGCTACIDPTI